jgi:hypothetical protein
LVGVAAAPASAEAGGAYSLCRSFHASAAAAALGCTPGCACARRVRACVREPRWTMRSECGLQRLRRQGARRGGLPEAGLRVDLARQREHAVGVRQPKLIVELGSAACDPLERIGRARACVRARSR